MGISFNSSNLILFKHTVSQSPASLLATGNLPLNPPHCHTLQSYRQQRRVLFGNVVFLLLPPWDSLQARLNSGRDSFPF